MDKLSTTKTFLNTIITFVSLVIAPVYGIAYIESLGIYVPYFDQNTIIILGSIVTALTLLSGITKKGAGATMTFIKYLASAYYSYRAMNMFTRFVLSTPETYGELIIDWGLWLALVIATTIVGGLLASLGKLAEEEKKKEKKK